MAAITLLLVNAMLIIANIVHLASNDSHEPTSMFSGWMWNGDYDRSHIEMFGHLLIIFGAIMLAFLAVNRRSSVYAAWSFGFAVLFADDFFRIHEDLGGWLVVYGHVEPMAGLRAQDIGELVILGVGAVVVGALLLVSLLRSSGVDRRNWFTLFGWLGVLAVFAVGIDQLHALLVPSISPSVSAALALTETAGELLSMTFIVLAVHRMTLAQEPPVARASAPQVQPNDTDARPSAAAHSEPPADDHAPSLVAVEAARR